MVNVTWKKTFMLSYFFTSSFVIFLQTTITGLMLLCLKRGSRPEGLYSHNPGWGSTECNATRGRANPRIRARRALLEPLPVAPYGRGSCCESYPQFRALAGFVTGGYVCQALRAVSITAETTLQYVLPKLLAENLAQNKILLRPIWPMLILLDK